MRMWIKVTIGGIVGAIILATVLISLFLGNVIETGAEMIGPKLTLTSVEIEDVNISMFAGSAEIKGFVVGNPEGFNMPYSAKMGHVKFDVGIVSLFSDPVVVDEMLIDGPEFTYEVSMKGSNIAKILENLEPLIGGDSTSEEDADDKTGSAEADGDGNSWFDKKYIIHKVTMKNGKINLSGKAFQGKAISMPLPEIDLTDIGVNNSTDEPDGATFREVVTVLVKNILDSVVATVSKSGKLPQIKTGNETVDGLINKFIKSDDGSSENQDASEEKATEKVLNKVKGLFKK